MTNACESNAPFSEKCRDIAIGSGISESTYKNLMSGRNRNPTIGILTGILDFIGGGSIDRLVGLALLRDFEKEAAQYDASLMESMQTRMKEKEQRVTELTVQIGTFEKQKLRYRRMYKDECIKVTVYAHTSDQIMKDTAARVQGYYDTLATQK